jgi:hypothetical protein
MTPELGLGCGPQDAITFELAAALARAVEARELQASSEMATGGEGTLKFPRNPLMEAAGIEPASAAAPAERLQA